MVSVGDFLATTGFLTALCLLLIWRGNLLSRRIDVLHKRITLTNRINGLNNGGWTDPE